MGVYCGAVHVRRGDLLALYTMASPNRLNTIRRYGKIVWWNRFAGIAIIRRTHCFTSIVSDVRAFSPAEQHDDITLIIAKRSV